LRSLSFPPFRQCAGPLLADPVGPSTEVAAFAGAKQPFGGLPSTLLIPEPIAAEPGEAGQVQKAGGGHELRSGVESRPEVAYRLQGFGEDPASTLDGDELPGRAGLGAQEDHVHHPPDPGVQNPAPALARFATLGAPALLGVGKGDDGQGHHPAHRRVRRGVVGAGETMAPAEGRVLVDAEPPGRPTDRQSLSHAVAEGRPEGQALGIGQGRAGEVAEGPMAAVAAVALPAAGAAPANGARALAAGARSGAFGREARLAQSGQDAGLSLSLRLLPTHCCVVLRRGMRHGGAAPRISRDAGVLIRFDSSWTRALR